MRSKAIMAPFFALVSSVGRKSCREVSAFSTRISMASVKRGNRLYSSGGDSLEQEERIVRGMLYRIRETNQMPPEIHSNLISFRVDGVDLGKVTPSMARTLCDAESSVFRLAVDASSSKRHLTLTEQAGSTCDSRTESVQQVMRELKDRDIVSGWRDEMYPISNGFYKDPVFVMERAAVPVLGGVEYGVHINGLVLDEENGKKPKMWMARRARDKSKYPGMLDHMVAGGQPAGLGLLDNVVKECVEEAGIPEELTRAGIKATGAISYETYSEEKDTVSRAVLFCYDLYLPSDFEPTAVDGEVDEFFLWDMDQVKNSMIEDYEDPIKPNCYPVIIDYLLREGHVSPEIPGYLDVLRELRSGDCN